MRRSVITAMSDSVSSSGEHVKTVEVMIDRTGSSSRDPCCAAQAAHDVALGHDAVDVLAVGGHHQRPDAVRPAARPRPGHRVSPVIVATESPLPARRVEIRTGTPPRA